MTRPFANNSDHPAFAFDRTFFAAFPSRRYRARAVQDGELALPFDAVAFAPDERGQATEVNLVIVKRLRSGRARYYFASSSDRPRDTDLLIEAFLRSRGQAKLLHPDGEAVRDPR